MRDKQAKSLAEEIYIMRSLDNPNIPKLYEVFENDGILFNNKKNKIILS